MISNYIYTGENNEDTEFLYYMNEGVYGPFSCKLLGNSIAAPSVHKVSRPPPVSQSHTELNEASDRCSSGIGKMCHTLSI